MYVARMIRKIYRNIKEYFKKTLTYSNGRFIVELTLISFLGKFLVALIAMPFFFFALISNGANSFLGTEYVKITSSTAKHFMLGLLISPWLETIINQVIPFWIISFFTKNLSVKIAILTILFAILHINPFSVISVLFVGFVLAWSYVMKGRSSRWEGFWTTTGIHFLYNAILGILALLFLSPYNILYILPILIIIILYYFVVYRPNKS